MLICADPSVFLPSDSLAKGPPSNVASQIRGLDYLKWIERRSENFDLRKNRQIYQMYQRK